MMNYEEFKQKVQNEFKNYLGEEYKDTEVFIRERAFVINVVLDIVDNLWLGYRKATQ